MAGVTISICQGFFAYRGFRLCNRNFLIPSLVGICILTSYGNLPASPNAQDWLNGGHRCHL